MKLTTQLVSFITLCVISAMAMVMLGGVFSFRQMGMELQQNRVDSLVEIIDKQLGVTDDQQALARAWLRPVRPTSSGHSSRKRTVM